ncbi:MAG: DUF3644 domain-containing protein [Polyangiaceae bacterium]
MSKKKRIRRVFSVKEELLKKSREAALAAVQVFNNPNITFKSETFIVLMNIAWTYLLHAYYREKNVDYRYYKEGRERRKYDRTKHGAYKHWELERCLNEKGCPLARDVAENLRFLIGVRHEIEHQMTSRIDDLLSAKFQACCINFHEVISSLFGESLGIAKHLAVSLQFASLQQEQVDALREHADLPANIQAFISGFQGALPDNIFQSPRFAYRVIFVPKTANHLNQADQVITFVKADSPLAKEVNAQYAVLRETERPKHLPSAVVAKMKAEGFREFGMHQHTELWKAKDAKGDGKGFGVQVANTWYWYDAWVDEVRAHLRGGTS